MQGATDAARESWFRGFVRLCATALVLVLMFNTTQALGAPSKDTGTPKPVIESARAGQCVAEPGFMRRNHMELLKHQRDDTVHGGIRGAKFSLKACIECHASQTSNSVTAGETNFCVSCHNYVAVKIDCFECHATQAQKTTSVQQLKP